MSEQESKLSTNFEHHPTKAAWDAWIRLSVEESLKGDAAATQSLARQVIAMLHYNGGVLSDQERAWLVAIMSNIWGDKDLALAVCRPAGKVGASSKGFAAFTIAFHVLDAVFEHGATSMEEAWAMVAAAHNLDEGTVKRHWIKWKPKVLETCETVQPGMPANIKEMIANNKRIIK